MKILPPQLSKENHRYNSFKSLPEFKEDLQKVFSEKGFDFYGSLNGEFIAENEFIISEKITAFRGSKTIIICKIQSQKEKTIVEVLIKSNPIVYPFTIVTLIFGCLILYSTIFHTNKDWKEMLIVGIVFTFIFPFATLFYVQAAKTKLKDKFVEILNLKIDS